MFRCFSLVLHQIIEEKKNVNKTNIMFKLQLEYAIFQLENWDGERLAIEL